jgi:hypothetical protein
MANLCPSPLLGFYEPFRRSLNKLVRRLPEEQIAATSFAAGAASGAVGGKPHETHGML